MTWRTCPECGLEDDIVVEPAAFSAPDRADYLTCGECRVKLVLAGGKLTNKQLHNAAKDRDDTEAN